MYNKQGFREKKRLVVDAELLFPAFKLYEYNNAKNMSALQPFLRLHGSQH